MEAKKLIKVVKRNERAEYEAAASQKRRNRARKSLDETKRDPVAIVTEWVSELRRKKAQEGAHGFESLFSNAG